MSRAVVSCALLAVAAGVLSERLEAAPPMTETIDHFDTYHGVKVADPYRWLEDDVRESKRVEAWVEAENKFTNAYLDKIPEREAIGKRLKALWDFEKYDTPSKVGGRIFFEKNDGLQNQYVLYVQENERSAPEVLLDPNAWAADGTVALAGTSISDDGRYLAYGVEEAGSDWQVWRVIEVGTKRKLDDEIRGVKFNSPAWTPDGKGFFYARFPEPVEGAAFQDLNLNQKVYYHRLGTSQADDVLVFERRDQPEWGYYCTVTEDGRYLVITVSLGTDDRFRVYYRDLLEPYGMPRPLIDHFENEYSFIGNDGPVFYFKTDLDAPRKRVIAMDTRLVQVPEGEGEVADEEATEEERGGGREGERGGAGKEADSKDAAAKESGAAKDAAPAKGTAKSPPPPFVELIPQQPETMTGASLLGNLFVVESLKDAKTQVSLYDLAGKHVRNVDFPGIGSANGFTGKRTDTETFYSFSSFATPPGIYRYDLITGKSELFRQAKVDFDPAKFEVRQVFYNSNDGTRVPMFLAHKKGLKLDGNNPTLLYGYGGFNIPMTPYFSISRLAWMELGGVFAMANLRGGGEYGEEWHRAGTKLKKQNVFDDFIAAAEWLIAQKYTQPKKLAIQGGSNGGLLVGACLTQRPDLYGACLPAVGVMDMLRFHNFTAGRYWVDDFGSSDDPEEFKAIAKYSPYHNIKAGTCYPPTMVTTADTDDRVVPGHSFKFAARLQAAQKCDSPILIRIETRAGHGSGKPTSKIIEEITDQWAFLVKELGVSVGK